MATELKIDELRELAQQAGVNLADDELQRLLAGVNRARKQAAELRAWIGRADEPAGVFDAASAERK
jgi:hypothetical protein